MIGNQLLCSHDVTHKNKSLSVAGKAEVWLACFAQLASLGAGVLILPKDETL